MCELLKFYGLVLFTDSLLHLQSYFAPASKNSRYGYL